MSKKETETLPILEGGLLRAMRALDNQVARALERSPGELEVQGVQKWGPYADRIESLSSFLLESFGEEKIALDSLIVLAQTFAKVLAIISDELGREGLGAVRSAYIEAVFENLEREMGRALRQFREGDAQVM